MRRQRIVPDVSDQVNPGHDAQPRPQPAGENPLVIVWVVPTGFRPHSIKSIIPFFLLTGCKKSSLSAILILALSPILVRSPNL